MQRLYNKKQNYSFPITILQILAFINYYTYSHIII